MLGHRNHGIGLLVGGVGRVGGVGGVGGIGRVGGVGRVGRQSEASVCFLEPSCWNQLLLIFFVESRFQL